MTDHEAVAKVLLDAADLIEQEGWWNARLCETWGPNGKCAALAIDAVAKDDDARWDAAHALCRSLGLLTDAPFPSSMSFLPPWNDAQDNPQPILDAFQSAAKAELRLADGATS